MQYLYLVNTYESEMDRKFGTKDFTKNVCVQFKLNQMQTILGL